jgi:hypothetical protein
MTWNDITVYQWQQLAQLQANSEGLDEVDLSIRTAAIATNRTEKQIQKMTLAESKKLVAELEFLKTEMKVNRVDYIDVHGSRYKVNYDVRNMPAARYIEAKYFVGDFAGNLHRLAACMVVPMSRTMFGYKMQKYDASKHDEYSSDLLYAPVEKVFGSVVFFYHVFKIWTKVFRDYLKQQMMAMGMTKFQAEATYQALCDSLDGFTKQHLWLNTKELRLNRRTN